MNDEAHFITPNPRRQNTPPLPKPAPRIVLVDDEPDFTGLVRCLIQESIPDARVRMFANGDVAWKYLEQQPPDLLISDLKHCGMDGFAMLSRLAHKGVSYPIVILSGFLSEGIRQARHCAGPRLQVHYLPKPSGLLQLVPLLEQCLTQPHPVDHLSPPVGSAERPLKIVHLDDE
jgi:CheY-like chemotaxis protein